MEVETMFEDFRKQIDDNQFPDEEQPKEPAPQTKLQDTVYFFGMTPVQRFVLATMLLVITVLLGVLFLLVTSKIVPPSMF
jgi:hypothetical protein